MIGFALFGAGRIGALHAANIAANPRARLATVFDIHRPSAQKVAAKHGARVADNADAALADNSIGAVLIASSTDTHVDLITRAAKAGKQVLCEKPIDLDIARVEKCRKEISGTGVSVQIGFNRRYDASHGGVARSVKNGEVGDLQLLVITSRDPVIAPMEYLRVSGGIFRDMTIHDFDLARFIAGEEPIEVYATGSIKIEAGLAQLGDVDTAMVVMKTDSGSLIHINNSRQAIYGYDQRVEAFGSKGMVCSDNLRASTLTRHTKDATDAREPLLNFFIERYGQAYRDELNDFIATVESGGKPSVDFEDGRRALILANAAWESLGSGRAVKVSYD